MEPNLDSENLSGMAVQDAKEYIFNYMATLKLTEKKRQALEGKVALWESRVDLAHSRGFGDLARDAGEEAEKARAEKRALDLEIEALNGQIERMRKQLPGLAARERSIDPDLLTVELQDLTGESPLGRPAEEATFDRIETETVAEAALAEIKAKMGLA